MPQESSHPTSPQPHRVAVVVDEGSNPFEMACACEIFGARRRSEIGFEPYTLSVVSPTPTVAMRDGMFGLTATGDLTQLAHADTVIVPNRPDVASALRPATLDALRNAKSRGARMVGLCTGAYTLAEAGLLTGRRATVHWQLLDDFATRFPDVTVEPDVLFVDDGDILTSAGSSAALDLALHIVRKDFGAQVANHVSRRLVFSAFRDGGQQQFVERPVPAATASPLGPALDWAIQRLDHQLTVSDLATQAHLSPTSLHRRFRDELGTTPLAWLNVQRIHHARRLLETDDLTLDVVAERSGLGTTANLRALMRRHLGVSPSAYRRQFQQRPQPLAP
jgi:AraC family transcriptional regulator, transcriptional activator FtrA